MSGRVPVGKRVKVFSQPPEQAEENLRREISQTDIEFDEDSLSGVLQTWLFDLKYQWQVEPAKEGAKVTERWALNKIGLAAFVSILPVITLVSGVSLLVFHTSVSDLLVVVHRTPSGEIETSSWPLYVLFGVILLPACFALFSIIRLLNIQWPLEELTDDLVREDAQSVLLGCLGLAGIPLIPAFGMVLVLFFGSWDQFEHLGRTLFPVSTLVLSTGSSAVLIWLSLTGNLDRLELSHGFLTSFDDSRDELVTRFQVVEARYNNMPEDDLLYGISQAAKRVGINLDPTIETGEDGETVGSGKISKFGIDARYVWRIERRSSSEGADDNDFLVTETMYLANDYKFVLHILALMAGILLLVQSGVAVLLVPMLAFSHPMFGLLAAGMFPLVLLPIWLFPRGLDERDEACAVDVAKLAIHRPIYLVCALVSIGLLVGTPVVMTLAGLCLCVLSIGMLTHYEWLIGDVNRRRSRLDLPPPLNTAAALTIGPALPAVAIVASDYLPGSWSSAMVVFYGLSAPFVAWGFLRMAASLRSLGIALFESHSGEHTSPAVRWGAYAITAVISVFAVVLPVLAAQEVLSQFGGPSNMGAVTLATLYLLPAGVPLAGVGYQLQTVYADVRTLFAESQPVTATSYEVPTAHVAAEVRIYDGPIDGICGLSTLRRDVIFVPEVVIDAFEPESDELAALIAHEDAHATVYNDGVLSVYSSLLAGLTFVGRNVLLAALNFREREFRADRYAETRVGSDALKRALRTVADRRASDSAEEQSRTTSANRSPAAGFTSFAPREGETTRFDSVFGLLYGSYTITKAHPTIEERIERIADDSES